SPAAFGFPGSPFTFNLFNASVNASYSFDFFGRDRRELEALQSQVDFSSYQLQGAQLSLTANVVTASLEVANRKAQIAATNEIIALENELLKSVQTQLNAGTATMPDLVAQRSEIALTRATLPAFEKALMRAQHQLVALVGELPGNSTVPDINLSDFMLPQDLPLSLPSELVHQRPDILAAEALLHRASAKVGVATANIYPQITLSGSIGPISPESNNLFKSDSIIWSLGGRLVQPIFHGGALRAQKRGAVAAFDQASAEYRQTVLFAFENVADVLKELEIDARAVQTQLESVALARESLRLTQQQFEFGAVNYLPLLNAQRALQQSLLALAQARATRFADTAALFQALGGGWWNREGTTREAPSNSR
ncbi:MAG TPA: efflux transporter outer membrane subunit, partial [Steroidobacteraceae bacterium]|nr:efflux transporter outer membrane subunit [Steroidobacteraceae bacterium]